MTFTLYVDNIHEFKDHIWLKKTFNKFGMVRDAFIPHKRSKRTGKKFGFVRYDCPTAAGMAVSRMNGVWVDNERLFVKEACFGHNEEMPRVHHTKVHSELAEFAREHLMLEVADTQDSCGDFESQVEDSVEETKVDVGLAAHNNSLTKENCLAQEGTEVRSIVEGVHGPGNGENSLGCINDKPNSINHIFVSGRDMEGQKEFHINLGENQSESLALRGGRETAMGNGGDEIDEDPTEVVRLSQIPSINLMVDLNEAGCRRRRRLQLSHLLLLHEAVDQNPELVMHSSSSSGETPQSNSIVFREVSATMAIGD